MRNRRKGEAPATAPKHAARVIVCASLQATDADRLDAFGARMHESVGLEPRRGTLATMLIRKGLDAVEAEARS